MGNDVDQVLIGLATLAIGSRRTLLLSGQPLRNTQGAILRNFQRVAREVLAAHMWR